MLDLPSRVGDGSAGPVAQFALTEGGELGFMPAPFDGAAPPSLLYAAAKRRCFGETG